MQIANVKHLTAKQNWVSACGKPNLGAYTAKPRQRASVFTELLLFKV